MKAGSTTYPSTEGVRASPLLGAGYNIGANASPEPLAKKRCITIKSSKAFKRDFNPPPSTMLECMQLLQNGMPFNLMVTGWWLQKHPNAKTFGGAEWLTGFYSCLKDEDLHPINREYLKELVALHQEKEGLNSMEDNTQHCAESSCQAGNV